MVLSAADRFGDAEAVVDGPLRLTFSEIVARIRCAAGAFAELGVEKGDRVAVWSGGSEPGSQVNPAAVEAMADVGIDIRDEFPKPWTEENSTLASSTLGAGIGWLARTGRRGG